MLGDAASTGSVRAGLPSVVVLVLGRRVGTWRRGRHGVGGDDGTGKGVVGARELLACMSWCQVGRGHGEDIWPGMGGREEGMHRGGKCCAAAMGLWTRLPQRAEGGGRRTFVFIVVARGAAPRVLGCPCSSAARRRLGMRCQAEQGLGGPMRTAAEADLALSSRRVARAAERRPACGCRWAGRGRHGAQHCVTHLRRRALCVLRAAVLASLGTPA